MSLRPLASAVAIAAISPCSSRIERQAVPAPDASALGDGQRISDLIGPSAAPLPASPATADVRVTGVVVTAIDQHDETGDGKASGNLYAQDAAFDRARAPGFHGITAFQSS